MWLQAHLVPLPDLGVPAHQGGHHGLLPRNPHASFPVVRSR